MWLWGGRDPVDHKNWMMFQNRIFQIKTVYRIFACASSHPHLPCRAFLLRFTTIVLVLCEVQVGLHPPGQSVKRTEGNTPASSCSNLCSPPPPAFPSLLPSSLLLHFFCLLPSWSPHFPLLPPSFLCALSYLCSPVLWGHRKEGRFSKITIIFSSSSPHPSFKLWESKHSHLHLGWSWAEHLKEKLILCRISKSFWSYQHDRGWGFLCHRVMRKWYLPEAS